MLTRCMARTRVQIKGQCTTKQANSKRQQEDSCARCVRVCACSTLCHRGISSLCLCCSSSRPARPVLQSVESCTNGMHTDTHTHTHTHTHTAHIHKHTHTHTAHIHKHTQHTPHHMHVPMVYNRTCDDILRLLVEMHAVMMYVCMYAAWEHSPALYVVLRYRACGMLHVVCCMLHVACLSYAICCASVRRMSCHVMSHVMRCHAMSCRVMSCDVSCHVA